MNITELSINDIVNEPYDDGVRPIQISALRSDGFEDDYKNGADDDWFDVNDLTSIPLTVKLLEKFGFIISRDENVATLPYTDTDIFQFRLERDFRKTGWVYREVIYIDSVDRLQHALRMSKRVDFANSLNKYFDIR